MNIDIRNGSKQSLNTISSSTDNDSYVTANSELIDDYNYTTTQDESDILYQARRMSSPKAPEFNQSSNLEQNRNSSFKKKAHYSFNATPKIDQDYQFTDATKTPSINNESYSEAIKRDLTITRRSQRSSLNNESIETNEKQNFEFTKILERPDTKKKVRATSSYYEPIDHTSSFDKSHYSKVPMPNLDYRKTYALTNEHKPEGTVDSEMLENYVQNQTDLQSEEVADCDTTAGSIPLDKFDQAKENLRQSMILSESVFDSQNAILEKESQKKASIFQPTNFASAMLEKSKRLTVTEEETNDDDKETKEEDNEDSQSVLKNNELDLKKEDFNHLFILSTKSFDKNMLEEEEDKSVCLSFDFDELAFVHAVEESGWGEVTLIKSLERGWVPLNYFTDCIKPLEIFLPESDGTGNGINDKIVELRATILSRQYLAPLFQSAGKFLVNPSNDINNNGKKELDIKSINNIQKAIKQLLISTGCISRNNEIVARKLLVKKTRKRLLADWYSISLKADKYRGSSDNEKFTILKKMVFQLLRRAYLFYNIWAIEVQTFENEKRLLNLKEKNIEMTKKASNSETSLTSNSTGSALQLPVNTVYLNTPPMAYQRLNEVNNFIFQYVGIILGRMDLIENNSAGYEVLEYIIRQIILLLRELLYISKSCSLLINEKYNNQYENNLDSNLDPLLALVSELVSAIKIFINKMFERLNKDENFLHEASKVIVDDQDEYKPSPEAMQITSIISKMTSYITNCIVSCNNYLRVIGDFQLGEDKKYPNFAVNAITANDFIKICSRSLLEEIKQMEWKIVQDKLTINKSLARYSIIQTGLLSDKNLILNNNGVDYLADLLEEDGSNSKETSLLKDKLLQKFTIKEASDSKAEKVAQQYEMDKINDRYLMFKELEFDDVTQQLVSGTLRSIVCYLTDEIVYQKHNFHSNNSLNKNDQLLVSTFFMNLKLFTDGKKLISLLVARFDEYNHSRRYEKRDYQPAIFTNWQSQLRHRQRLVLKFIRTWLESYWDYKSDYSCLSILMNFLNETCNKFLPLESKNLMTIVSKIMLIRNNNDNEDHITQLVPKALRNSKLKTMMLRFSEDLSFNDITDPTGNDLVEEYDLMERESKESLPVPISGLGTANLLTPREFVDVKNSVEEYNKILDLTEENISLPNIVDIWSTIIKDDSAIEKNSTLMLCDINSMEVAKQLTLIESYLFAKIDVDEFLNVDLNNNKPGSTNIKQLIDFTNCFSSYIIESLVSGKTTSLILKRFLSWLKIALSCFYYKNFNSLACIVTSLQNHNISRMKFIWNNLKGKDLELYTKLIKIMEPTSNYKNYRMKLKYFTERLKKNYEFDSILPVNPDGNNCVVIPFLNLFLQDLIMVSELNSATLSLNPNKKRILISKFYKVTYILEKIQELQFFIMDNLEPMMTDKGDLEKGGNNKEFIANIPALQSFIFFDIWSIHKKYLEDPDRAYKLLNR
ncbi:hypothetical protein ACO0SA_002495 [Hanseniaspora valbyensis]